MVELLDLCRFTAGSTGTSDFSDGSAEQGFLNLSEAGANDGKTYPYRAENATRSEWELGYAVYSSGTGTLSRTPIRSSNGGSVVNFSTAPVVLITPLAADLVIGEAIKWLSKAIGEYYVADTGETGVDIPPKDPDDGMGVWVELTADLTGTGQYNEGKLTSQSVTGSAPLVQATAVVNWASSPMHGQTIRLLNTERRFLRAGSAGTVENDQMQTITGRTHYAWGAATSPPEGAFSVDGTSTAVIGTAIGSQSTRLSFNSANSPGARAGTETRSKNIGVRMFRRVG